MTRVGIEEICERHASDHYSSYEHFKRLADAADTTDGWGKRYQSKMRERSHDYYNLYRAVEACLEEYRRQENETEEKP